MRPTKIFQSANPGGTFKNTYEIINLRAFEIAALYKNHIFEYMGQDILSGISKVSFETPHKISYSCIESWAFPFQFKIKAHYDLRANKCFWHASWQSLGISF